MNEDLHFVLGRRKVKDSRKTDGKKATASKKRGIKFAGFSIRRSHLESTSCFYLPY